MEDSTKKAVNRLCSAILEKRERQYTEIMEEAKNDRRFENMIKDMTINQLSGAGSLAKFKTKF